MVDIVDVIFYLILFAFSKTSIIYSVGIYEADFEASKVKEIHANYHGDLYSFLAEYPLEEKLSKELEFSKIQRRQLSQFVKYYLSEKYKWPKI